MIPSGDHLLTLLGKQFDDPLVQEALARPIGFMALCKCFGRPSHDPALRSHLSSLADSGTGIRQVDRHGTCNLIREAAIRLFFHQSEPGWIFTGCEIYRDRVCDACTWTGEMPYGLAFQDMPDEVSRKLGRKPEREVPGDLESVSSCSWASTASW